MNKQNRPVAPRYCIPLASSSTLKKGKRRHETFQVQAMSFAQPLRTGKSGKERLTGENAYRKHLCRVCT